MKKAKNKAKNKGLLDGLLGAGFITVFNFGVQDKFQQLLEELFSVPAVVDAGDFGLRDDLDFVDGRMRGLDLNVGDQFNLFLKI